MTATSWIAAAAGALTLCGVALPSLAQTQSQVQTQTQTETQAQPQTPSSQPTAPQPVVVETKVDLTTGGPQSPESPADARKEAVAALAEAKVACRREASKQAQADCLRQAQDDYNSLMGRSRDTMRN